ncbi:hypothetical protein Rleg9DRAFT_5739 [Rhizobium leguminosarum bv. trifolii WSM597]|nr:hypothetical protein Rleg2_4746 [Rhizobium leguminosarum bv. trifolii WSM2304]EJB06780.1 hypothetical protein Rleg9DRAFT_5739 [Rhizobium leguminosarum bv. trifolii WSM597]
MVSRIKRTLTVGQRAAAVERTNTIAQEATDEERCRREEKTERLRRLRLAAAGATPQKQSEAASREKSSFNNAISNTGE